MLTFDKLKIVANIEAIEITNIDEFEKIEKAGSLAALKFYQEVPYLLMIKVDYAEKEVVVEFCGKILGKDYPKLISAETIKTCFDNINAMGFCRIDFAAMMDAEVVKADVTTDVHGVDVPQLTSYVRSHINNYRKFVSRIKRNGNFVIDKNVTTDNMKKRMTIYDKGKEMQKVKNKRYAEMNGLQQAFDDVCRFELNLNSKQQVRDALKIDNNKLKNVLASTARPIYDFMVQIIGPVNDIEYGPASLSSKKEYLTRLVLQDCQYDLEKVEAKMRELYPQRGTNFKKVMEPYRLMMERETDNGSDYIQTILEKLA